MASRFAPPLLAAVLAAMSILPAAASSLIGLAAPLSGDAALLGAQLRAGAEVAAATLPDVSVAVEDDSCSAEGGARAARRFVEQQARAVVGFLCAEAIEAALPILSPAGIPVLTVGVRANTLTDRRLRTKWLVARMAPRADAEAQAVADLLPRIWRNELFAIVDDGTIYGRELSESLRAGAEAAGLKPAFVDTFRPQADNQIGLVGRLRRAGATRAFIAGDRDDVAIVGRDAASLQAGLVLAGGEVLRAQAGDVPLPEGTLTVGLPQPELRDAALAAAFAARGVVPEGYVLPSYAAVQIAAQALTGQTGAPPIFDGRRFDTAIGPVTFDAQGDLAANPYRLLRLENSAFREIAPP